MLKRIFAAAVVLLLVAGLTVTAFAHPVPDLDAIGSITFVMELDSEKLDSGMLNLYQVGLVEDVDGDICFKLVPELEEHEIFLNDLKETGLAETLLTAAKVEKLPVLSAYIEDGEAVFEELETGLYVVWQDDEDACDGLLPINPFLISMPRFENGEYITDVVAQPKVGYETEPTVPPTTEPPDPEAPQTGQLNWPVPVMGISGAVLFVAGFLLWTTRKRADYEK